VWPSGRLEPQAFPEKMMPSAVVSGAPLLGGAHTLEEIEREHVLRVLASAPSLDDAARVLGVDASTLYRKRKKWEPG
jgi:NtrC-family two-component system response regulator AlgB